MSYNPDLRTKPVKFTHFRSAYSEHLYVGLECEAVSLYTDQSFKDESDINTIMARYQSTGEMPVLNEMQGQWLDVTEMDFQAHMDFIIEAQGIFDSLPSDLRDRFGNDPGAFLGFCSDEANRPEMAKLGLLNEEATRRILHPEPPSGGSENAV